MVFGLISRGRRKLARDFIFSLQYILRIYMRWRALCIKKNHLGWCDSMLRLKIFLQKVSLSQPSFRAYIERENNKKKKLLLGHDDDGTNSRIKNPDANDNRTFGLVSDDDYPNSRLTGKCTILTIYYNNNNNHNSSENNVDNNFKGNDHHLLHS